MVKHCVLAQGILLFFENERGYLMVFGNIGWSDHVRRRDVQNWSRTPGRLRVYSVFHSPSAACLPNSVYLPPFFNCGIVYSSCADLNADNPHNNFPMAGMIQSGTSAQVDFTYNARGMACPPLPGGSYSIDNATGANLSTVHLLTSFAIISECRGRAIS